MNSKFKYNVCLSLQLQRWARAYYDNTYRAVVDTNNGVEAMKKTLKYNYLPKETISPCLS